VFLEAGMVRAWDTESEPSDDFATTFRTSVVEIDVVFKVREAGDVLSAWIANGQWIVLPGGLVTEAQADNWTAFTFTPRSGEAGFRAGDYEVILAKAGSPDTLSLEFTIEQDDSDAELEQVGLSQEWDASVEPDPDTFTTSFLPDDGEVYAVFQLADGDGGQVESVWKYEGDELVFEDQPRIQLEGGDWGVLFLSAPEFPPGDYESIISLTGTDETESLRFTVAADGATPASPQIEEAGRVSSIAQAPAAGDFKDTFSTSDTTVYAVFMLSDEGDAVVWISAAWTYEGLPILAASTAGVVETGIWLPANLTFDAGLPPGEYEVVLTVLGTGANETLSFTVE
jgi:hypothetical protein